MVGGLLTGALAGCAPLGFGTQAPVAAAPVDTTPARPAWEAPAAAAVPRSSDEGIARLVRLAEVWHAVRWFHPGVVEAPAAWDTAYLRHVDRARAATSDAAFAQAVAAMLGELGDAETGVVGDTVVRGVHGALRVAITVTADSLVLARPVTFADDAVPAARALPVQVPGDAAVLDLRADSGRVADGMWRSRAVPGGDVVVRGGALRMPARRSVRRSGPEADGGGAEWTLMTTPPPFTDVPSTATPSTATGDTSRLVVVVDDATIIPAPLFARHAAGRAVFVSTGTGLLRSDAAATHLPIGGGFHARIRLQELLLAGGQPVPARADTVLPLEERVGLAPDTTERALAVALEIARGAMRVAPTSVTASSRLLASAPAAITRGVEPPYPSHPERLLAVTQLWGTVRAFNPYLPMSDETWDDAFTRALGDAEAAANARAYAAVLFRFAATLDASQATITVPDHPEFGRRTGQVPFRLRLVDGSPIVVHIDDSASARSGVRVGDEITAIGGEPIDKRFGRLRELVSASNAWSRERQLLRWLESGPALVKATYAVRTETQRPRDVEFSYAERADSAAAVRSARRVESLSGGVVQVTLGAANTPLPADLASAAAVVVDARGVSSDESLAWLAGSVLDADEVPFARDERSVLSAPPTAPLRTPELDAARATTRTVRTTPRAPRDAFTGPMAILVDAGTMGEGELIALRLLAGGRSRVLVGMPTAGAVGAVRTLALPGGVRVTIPVAEVRHPDGAFIQRLGLTPAVSARPTVTGVRNGRDEVLEAAQRWITQQLAPPAPLRRR